MKRRVPLLLLAELLAFTILFPSEAQQIGDSLWSAVDTRGVRHRGSDYGGKIVPWIRDAIYAPRPQYPYEVRAKRITGTGLLRISLDLSSGNVVKAIMIKSTGSPVLDNAAISAFRQWRFKPGKWKEIELQITFTMRPPQ